MGRRVEMSEYQALAMVQRIWWDWWVWSRVGDRQRVVGTKLKGKVGPDHGGYLQSKVKDNKPWYIIDFKKNRIN